jgi:hypothetical protein
MGRATVAQWVIGRRQRPVQQLGLKAMRGYSGIDRIC